MRVDFIKADRDTPFLFPPSVQEWLPKDHLARFVVDIVSQLDLSSLRNAYSGRGSSPYDPAMLLSLILYGYATGVFSSRKLEQATYDSVAFRYLTANEHPDHDTIAAFRKRFSSELQGLFLQVLSIAHEMGVLKLGSVSLDGTKVKANASKHQALSWQHACKLEDQLKKEIEQLWRLAEEADQSAIPDGMSIPQELERREERLATIAEAKRKIEARAAERYAEEQQSYEKKLAERKNKEQQSGKKGGGKPPKPPESGPRAKDQVNLTDDESRIMPKSGGGFEQSFNAQACVDVDSLLILAAHATQQANDKQQVKPALEELKKLPAEIGAIGKLIADSGYFSQANVEACEATGIEPYIACSREAHNPRLEDRCKEPDAIASDADSVSKMKYRLKTRSGKDVYAKRKCTVEPVFGIIKSVLGYSQFMRRGLKNVIAEWKLVSLAWNLKRLHVLSTTGQKSTGMASCRALSGLLNRTVPVYGRDMSKKQDWMTGLCSMRYVGNMFSVLRYTLSPTDC